MSFSKRIRVITILIVVTGCVFAESVFADKSEHFGEIIPNVAKAGWLIFLSEAKLDGRDLESGDEIAAFDGDTLVGVFTVSETLTEKNQDTMTVWPEIDDGTGYTAGNSYTFKCWDASEEVEAVAEKATLSAIEEAYVGNGFPEESEDIIYSIVRLAFGEVRMKVDINGDGAVDLADVISGLKILTGTSVSVNLEASLNENNKKIGLKEVIYVLQGLADKR